MNFKNLLETSAFRDQFAVESGTEVNKLDDDHQSLTEQARAVSDTQFYSSSGNDVTTDSRKRPEITMYTTRYCPYCVRARILLEAKGVAFEDIAVDGNSALRQEMVEKSMCYTVPQIWIGDQHIGGCDELYQLERQGDLDALLSELSDE